MIWIVSHQTPFCNFFSDLTDRPSHRTAAPAIPSACSSFSVASQRLTPERSQTCFRFGSPSQSGFIGHPFEIYTFSSSLFLPLLQVLRHVSCLFLTHHSLEYKPNNDGYGCYLSGLQHPGQCLSRGETHSKCVMSERVTGPSRSAGQQGCMRSGCTFPLELCLQDGVGAACCPPSSRLPSC